jgi:hypothetical protein
MASLNTKKKGHDMTLKIQVLAWDRQTNLAMLMGSPPLLITGSPIYYAALIEPNQLSLHGALKSCIFFV